MAIESLWPSLLGRGTKPALVDPRSPSRTIGYAELAVGADRWAAGLSSLGVTRGDRVAIWAEPCIEMVVALLAAYRVGALVVPINTRYRADEAHHVLADSGATVLVHDLPQALGDAATDIVIRHRIAIGDPLAGELAYSDIGKASPIELPPMASEEGGLIVYTSGTTARSKGVVLSHRAVFDNVGALTGLWQWSASDMLVLALPLFHVHGLCIGLHGALMHGMTTILTPFSPQAVIRAFADHGATVFMGVPTMYTRLLEHLRNCPTDGEILGRGRMFTSGSAALAVDTLAEFETATGHRILERYGMTETLITLSNPYEGERRPGTVGLPVPGCEVQIVDDDGDRPCEPGELGELWVRSNGIMVGYWQDPAATAAAFRDEWFRTGDVAMADRDGWVKIVGRKSVDIIKSGGFKISAREIEDVLQRHPRVREVAVVGVADVTWGERVVAAVVVDGAGSTSEIAAELVLFVADRLADYKKPREVVVLGELPRNAMGKVEKPRLRLLLTTTDPERR